MPWTWTYRGPCEIHSVTCKRWISKVWKHEKAKRAARANQQGNKSKPIALRVAYVEGTIWKSFTFYWTNCQLNASSRHGRKGEREVLPVVASKLPFSPTEESRVAAHIAHIIGVTLCELQTGSFLVDVGSTLWELRFSLRFKFEFQSESTAALLTEWCRLEATGLPLCEVRPQCLVIL